MESNLKLMMSGADGKGNTDCAAAGEINITSADTPETAAMITTPTTSSLGAVKISKSQMKKIEKNKVILSTC
jgi:hypothetical protein